MQERQVEVSVAAFKFKEGQNMDIESLEDFVGRCKINLALMQRCRFAFGGSKKWVKLIDMLKEYNDNLRDFTPKLELGKMMKTFDHLKSLIESDLHIRIEAADYEASHTSTPEDAERYRNLALCARFLDAQRRQGNQPLTWFLLNGRDFQLCHDVPGIVDPALWTMGLKEKEWEVIIIEWARLPPGSRPYDGITRTARMLCTPHPKRLLLPDCYGLINDEKFDRVGFVLKPPDHISAIVDDSFELADIRRVRAPISLRDVIRGKHPTYPERLPLGKRFLLAKKLVGALHMMHAVDYAHK